MNNPLKLMITPNLFIGYFNLLLLVGLSESVSAQDDFNRFKHISTSDRFSLNSVNAIGQDEKGLIWFGTRDGLMRYDGNELKVIHRIKERTDLSVNSIYSIEIDTSAGIWVATKHGLSLYDPRTDSSVNFSLLDDKSLSISSRFVRDVKRFNDTIIWIASHWGLGIFDRKAGVITEVRHDPDNPESLSADGITCLYKTKDSTMWVGTRYGLNRLRAQEKGRLKFDRFYFSESEEPDDPHNFITCIQEDYQGNLWIGTRAGLYYLDTGENTVSSFKDKIGHTLTDNLIHTLTYDLKKRLWIGTYNGLNILDSGYQVLNQVKHNPKIVNGLTGNSIRALFTDRRGGVWIATYFGGVNYWDDNQVSFENINERNGTQLGYNVVSAIAEDEKSNIYFGTEGAGLNILNPITNDFSKIDELSFGNPIGTVKCLVYAGDQKLWIGTFNRGLIHLDLKTGNYTEYREGGKHPIASDEVVSFAQTNDKKLWIGSLRTGLELFDPKTNKGISFRYTNKRSSIAQNNVRSLLMTKDGDLYVGTGKGLCVMTKESYESEKFVFKTFLMEDGSINNLYVHDLIEDRHGRIWLSVYGAGLYYVEGSKLIQRKIDGVSTVFSIVEEPSGKFWLSSDEGVVSYDPVSGEQQIFNVKDGVQPNEFNSGAKLLSAGGRLFFGGASGVTVFRPGTLGVHNDYAPDVVLTSFSLSGEELRVHDGSGILSNPIEYTDRITLDHDQNIFTIGFTMPSYIDSEHNSYSYRLKGLDDTWVHTNNSFVSFTIQRGGNYVFEIKGLNNDGVQSEGVTALEIKVENPPWLAWWAYTIYFVLFASSLLLFIYFFKSRLSLQHKLELETQHSLHQQEVHQQKLQFFTNISHEFRTPLTLIAGPLDRLINEYKGPSTVFRQLLVIKKNTDQLFKLINELMDFRKLESKQMKLQAAEGNIVKFAKEIYLSFDQQAKLKKLDYEFFADKEDIDVFFDRDKLEKVLYNLISNAFKFTPQGGQIKVSITQKRNFAKISVRDSGEGIPPEHLDKIFDRFYEIPKQTSKSNYQPGSGIGLAIAKNIMELHQGSLKVTSDGAGSIFVMKLKLGRAHLADDEIIASFRNSEDIALYTNEVVPGMQKYVEADLSEGADYEEGRPTLLIVEDNEEIGQFIKGVLNKHFNIILVENGAMGYQEAIASQPNLIISDVMMPVMDGIEFCSKIKTDIRTSHIPFILLTARTSLIYKYDGLESGADEYLSKPFEIKELVLRCQNIIKTQEKLKSKFSETGELLPKEGSVNSMDEEMMNKAVKIIRENIGNEFFSIQLLCDKIGISRSLLFTKFKAWTNQTPNEYILATKMKMAASLIEQGKVNISEIGYMVGFKNANYFSKSFKKFYSISPKDYSKKFKNSLGIEE